MKKLLLAGIAAACFSAAPVHAQSPTWTGFYVGAQGGWGFQANSNVIFNDNAPIGGIHGSNGGGIAGGTLGVNWQSGKSVIGIEGDYSWASIVTEGIGNAAGTFCTTPCRSELSSLGTLRGRLGFAPTGTLLIYATAGSAYGHFQNSEPTFGSASGSRFGWTVGGGIEGMITPNFTWKVEFLFVDFEGGKRISYNSFGAAGPQQSSFSTDIIRAGLNYKFGSY